MKFLLITTIAGFLVSASCSNDSNFASRNKSKKNSETSGDAKGSGDYSDLLGDDVKSIVSDTIGETNIEVFDHIASIATVKTPTQYLIVIDNSVSMDPYISKVRSGFAGIGLSAYPENSQIAVINTMVADYADPNNTHSGLKKYTDIKKEPGYLDFVDDAAIKNFKASSAPSEYRNKFSKKGCSKWFKPGETNADGSSCVDAHLQIAGSVIGCEPGMHAFEQLVKKHPAGLFKSGHQLQVIFVSDEPGPGCNNAELLAKCPSALDLKTAALNNTKDLVDVRFHGIINDSNGRGCNYGSVVRENMGSLLDIKDSPVSAYKNIIESIVSEKRSSVATFSLAKNISKILAIVVDGAPYTGKWFIADNKLTLTELPDRDKLDVRIKYVSK